jgi:hypothetical protein
VHQHPYVSIDIDRLRQSSPRRAAGNEAPRHFFLTLTHTAS